MKGLVKFGSGWKGMEIRELQEPIPLDGQLKIKVMAAGICGSDIHGIVDGNIPLSSVVMGHEYVGVVDAVGSGVTGFKAGDWVVSMTAYSTCGTCIYCRDGLQMLCLQRKSIGTHVNGAMAEYIIVPSANAFKVPDEIEEKIVLAACEPFTCAVRCGIENTLIRPGDVVVVAGPGTLGISMVQIAKLRGAYVIAYGLPTDKHRLDLAKQMGADEVSYTESDLRKRVWAKNPYGADIAFETAGAEASMNLCVEILRKKGTLGQMGVYGKKINVNFDKILDNELSLTNSFATQKSSWEISLKLLREKKVDISTLITTKLPLEKWREGFGIAASKGAFKVLLIP